MMSANHHIKRLMRLPDVAPELEIIEGNAARALKWWLEDHFLFGYGMAITPTTRVGQIDTLDTASDEVRVLFAELGIIGTQRLMIWWSSDKELVTLPADLVVAHHEEIWYWPHNDDVVVSAPPDDWAVYFRHDGQFGVGRADPAHVERARAEDCRRPEQWAPPDDTPPDEERRRELMAAINANRRTDHPPCSGVVIRTRGELKWITAHEIATRPPVLPRKSRWDLRQAIMVNANLDGVLLAGAYLSRTNFTGANLTDAKLQFADLSSANLTGATLYRAHLYRASLAHSVMRSACLNRAYLREADLIGADFTDARLEATQISTTAVPQIAATAMDTSRLWLRADDDE
jgi:hypothetical protein